MTFNYRSPLDFGGASGYNDIRQGVEGLSITAVGVNGYLWVPYQDLPMLIDGLLAEPDETETAPERAERFSDMAGPCSTPPVNLLTLVSALLDRIAADPSCAETWPFDDRVTVNTLLIKIRGHLDRLPGLV